MPNKVLEGLTFVALGVFVFCVIFVALVPWIISTLPVNEWKSFMSLCIYVLVGWFGGIAFPLTFVIGGIIRMFK